MESDLFDLLGGHGGGGGFFSHAFGSPFGGGRSRPRKAQTTAHPLNVTLEDLYKGKKTKLQVTRKILCTSCKGAGGKDGMSSECRKCGGRGRVMATRMVGPGMIQQSVQACPECKGEGSTIPEEDKCKTCKGNKTMTDKKTLEVNITPGMRDQQKIMFQGEGDHEPGVEPGDIVLVIQCKDHEVFTRKGDDLFVQKKIPLADALCGYTCVLEHLDGRKLVIKTNPGEVIEPESIRGVMGEGMPIPNRHENGNLYLLFDVQMPSNHFLEDESHYKRLESAFPPKPVTKPLGEEVSLHDFDERRYNGESSRREAYHGDDSDDEMGGRGPGVQCAQQ